MDLDDLYRAVPAAQEEDLLEEVRHDRLLAGLVPPEPEPQPDPEAEPAQEDPPLTPGQVLGLVQHQLGAVVLPEEPDAG